MSERIEALTATAQKWRNPEYPPRRRAATRALEGDNRFTEEALAFAMNRAMHHGADDDLADWLGAPDAVQTVAVIGDGAVPLQHFHAFLAVVLTGHQFVGVRAERSPQQQLRAFVGDVQQQHPGLAASFAETEAALEEADALVALAPDFEVKDRCEKHGIPLERRWQRTAQGAAAVLDGSESEEDRERLAEDAWLFDGRGSASVKLIWAPSELSPDPYLDAMAQFRGVFPAHEDTPGALAMQRAMLDARDQPHAFAEGLEFLLSKGEPEVQLPGHLRWSEYDALADVEHWVNDKSPAVGSVVARSQLAQRLDLETDLIALGSAHRRPLGNSSEEQDLFRFLKAIGRP